MAQINCIKEMYFEKGMSYASIARATGHDVKTVKKYINMKDFNQPLPKPAKKRGSKLDIFYDEQMTAAMIDRLVHHSYLLLFDGQSYRIRKSLMKGYA